ncbi:MAG: hypothetical protein M9962_09835 [Oligoflexia bacterium]|nr:hypothetical protein [Oligoflexia bacterium]
MKKLYKIRKVVTIALFVFAGTYIFVSCLDTKPKTLGNSKIDFTATDTANVDTFKFNFAYRDSAAAAPLNKYVYLQGAANTKTTMIATCNSAGTNCVCEFLDATETELEESDSTEISFDSNGNYFRCEYDGVLGSLAKVRIRNLNSTAISPIFDILDDTSLTAQKLIGSELNVNRIRTVSKYYCDYHFLQKIGTTITSFDCSAQAASGCGSVYCILKLPFPFYLYSDNLSTNFPLRIADALYNGGSTDKICDVQIKRLDCTDTGTGTTTAEQFGLYSEQTGIYEIPVLLAAGPSMPTLPYGFAAKTSTFLGNTVCPPGLVRRIFYNATTANIADTNLPGSLVANEIQDPDAAAPADLTTQQYIGGNCTGTSCTAPNYGFVTNSTSFAYSDAGQTEFCVIPTSLLD